MKVNNRVMVFIDGSNLFHTVQRLGLKIDYHKLLTRLVGDRVLIRPYFYSSIAIPPTQPQYRFYQALKYLGFTVVTRPLRPIAEGAWIEKGVDLALTIDILVSAFRDLYDIAILVSGDQDYTQVVDEIKRLGKRVEVAAFDFAIAQELKSKADQYTALDNLVDQISMVGSEKSKL